VKVLLDTHAFLWWVSGGGVQLSDRVRELIETPATEALFSAASAHEIATKVRSGRLQLPGTAARYIPDRVARHRFAALPVQLEHALRAGELPMIHRDPWDRLLIAQAQVERVPILTADPAIGRYDVETIW
jgi:PIN domain nuclease of toxin-antitoxin system